MAKIQKTIEVSKEANELGNLFLKLVIEGKKALADGWQTGTDLPAILGATMGDFLVALDGIGELSAEVKEDPAAFIMAFVVPASGIYAELKKEVVEPTPDPAA